MSETIILPERLDHHGSLDLSGINRSLKTGESRLDWSALREATPESLATMLGGLRLDADADVLGLDTVPDDLADPVADALATGSQAHSVDRQVPAPGRDEGPAVWAVPREVAAETEPALPSAPVAVLSPEPASLLAPPPPSAIRAELEQLILAELLGPAGGEEEDLVDKPRERYLVGMLAPRNQRVEPEEQDELAEAAAGEAEEGPEDQAAARQQTIFPSSFGLSCAVTGTTPEVMVTARWGVYVRSASVQLTTKTGAPKLVWKRMVRGGFQILQLQAGRIAGWAPDPEQPDVYVRGVVRAIGDSWHLTLWLTNEQEEPKRARDSAWLFQPELAIASPDEAAVFQRRAPDRAWRTEASGAEEDQALAMRYRQHVEFAVGHGVGVHADVLPGDPAGAVRVSTRVVPAWEVRPVTHSDARDFPELGALTLDMATLATLPDGEFGAALQPLVVAYDAWIAAQTARSSDPNSGLSAYEAPARDALQHCRVARERIAEGIALLDSNVQAADAFRFANRAMWQQRIHTLLAEARLGGTDATFADVDVPTNRSWRLFQIAFVLLNLPALTDLRHADRGPDASARADLLWFPTGGGKTEAYLGLTAYTLAIRRLQGTVAGRSGLDGVAVFMRYTLRLLTLQQFQRAAALLCACEVLRREARDQGDRRWGATPFRLGLWVGRRTTPNTTAAAAEAVQREHGAWMGAGGSGSPAQLVACPWCGAAIVPGRDIVVDKDLGRTLLYCGDGQGDCPFSRRGAPREGLPVLVVDEEIYRLLPSLLIATVDKFAQMPWQGPTQMLFGRVDGWYPRHGFRSPDLDDRDSHPARSGLPAARTQPHGPLRPPDLIIQDELHLISGPLGTLVGLYETVVDCLCEWEVDGRRVRPKVIASTATIRRAGEQLHALFLRQAAIFPPPGLDAGDSFFAREREPSERQPGRRYLGICAPGTRLKAVLIRVYVAHLAAAWRLYEQYGPHADPWLTLAGYFNTVRELGGMRRLVEDDVRARLGRAAERGLGKRPRLELEELTSRKSSTDIPAVLQRLETSVAESARRRQEQQGGAPPSRTPLPIDVLLATNMISVGIDVKRLGLMVVAGQPKTTAEYIQATSRVGRNSPGLICTVFNWARPRDLSHYEQFEHYHGGFYQHVEALSVTPFAARALDRGLSGLLVAYVRLMDSAFNGNERAGRIEHDHPYLLQAVRDIAERATLVTGRSEVGALVQTALEERVDAWVGAAQNTAGGRQLGYKARKDGITVGLLRSPEEGGWEPFTCLNSLRDVEPTVPLLLDDRPMGDEDGHPFVTAAEPPATLQEVDR